MSSSSRPPGIPYIIANEAAERFSYYGMKVILVVYMVEFLRSGSGASAPMSESEAKTWYHLFSASNYFFPVLGALLADIFLGKYRTIISLSVFYCLGHAALALSDTRVGLFWGLLLIALGSGGIKPCVSAHLGDQFKGEQSPLLQKYFGYFYLAINGGAFVSTLATPWLLVHFGPHVAFGVPGVLMLLATYVFYLGRHTFVALPPAGWSAFRARVFDSAGLRRLGRLVLLYLFIAVFWALNDQTGSSWVLQAQHLERSVSLPMAIVGLDTFKIELLPAQLQALNPFLIFLFVPLFSRWLFPWLNRHGHSGPLLKIGAGFFLAALSFLLLSAVEGMLSRGVTPTILWQVPAYALMTAAEVLVYWTGLEFSYVQAPKELRSFVMGLYLLSIALGNALTAAINATLASDSIAGILSGANYYLGFAALMLVTLALYIPFARTWKVRPNESPE
ncbi:MAG: MFS transporter [Deltaproteobacteria bacterium]|nr:MFS transporter [Deltaproteobacteria bacterium]